MQLSGSVCQSSQINAIGVISCANEHMIVRDFICLSALELFIKVLRLSELGHFESPPKQHSTHCRSTMARFRCESIIFGRKRAFGALAQSCHVATAIGAMIFASVCELVWAFADNMSVIPF